MNKVGNRNNDLVIAISKDEYKKLTAEQIAEITTLPINEVKRTIESVNYYSGKKGLHKGKKDD